MPKIANLPPFEGDLTGSELMIIQDGDATKKVPSSAVTGSYVPKLVLTSGNQLSVANVLYADPPLNGATYIVRGGRRVGWTIAAGSKGNGTYIVLRLPFDHGLADRLKNGTIALRTRAIVTPGYKDAVSWGGNFVRVDRKDGSVAGNEGEQLGSIREEEELLWRDFSYQIDGDERWIGATMQIGSTHAPVAQDMSFEVVSAWWELLDLSVIEGASTSADAVLDARLATLAPAIDVFPLVKSECRFREGATPILDENGRVVGASIPSTRTGQGTVLQWSLPMTGAMRDLLVGNQARLSLGFTTPAAWNRDHSLNMQVNGVDLVATDLLTANRIDDQISNARRKFSFTFVCPADLTYIDLRPWIGLSDTDPAEAAEDIILTDFTMELFRVGSDLNQPAAITGMLAQEMTRAAAVEQAVASVSQTGKRIRALLNSASFETLHIALATASALASPGAMAAVTVPAGVHVASSLGLIRSGTDGDHVELRGVGVDRTIIDGRLAPETPVITIQKTSPLDFNGTQSVFDLSVWAENCRYGFHIDAVNFKPNSRLIVKNVKVTHFGNDKANAFWGVTTWGAPHAIAIGTCSGSHYSFHNVKATGPRAAFSAHNQVNFDNPSIVEIVNSDLTGTWEEGWSLRLESVGSRLMDRCILQDTKLSGDISMAVTPWYPTALEDQPADRREWDLHGGGNTPAAFRYDSWSRALRIVSATDGPGSRVEVSGTAAAAISTRDFIETLGDVGLPGSTRSWGCIQDKVGVGPGRDVFVTALGLRLGDCTVVPKTLTVTIDRGLPSEATVSITFDLDYRAWTNAQVLALINAALAGKAVAGEYDVEGRYRPLLADEEMDLQNTSGTMIFMGMALARDERGARTVRPMTVDDLPNAFAGVAWQDIRPGAFGRVKTHGWLPLSDLLRTGGAALALGEQFGIDPDRPGHVVSGKVDGTGILQVVRASLGKTLTTVEVRSTISAEDAINAAAVLLQQAQTTIGMLGTDEAIAQLSRLPGFGAGALAYSPESAADAGSTADFMNRLGAAGYPVGSLAATAAMQIPAVVQRVSTAFHHDAFVGGGANYQRRAAEPSHAGKFQSADGAWWELKVDRIEPQMFGACGRGNLADMAADTLGLQTAIDVSAATSVPAFVPAGVYYVDGYKGAKAGWTAGEWAHGALIMRPGAVLHGAGIDKTILRNGAHNWRAVLRVRDGATSIRHMTIDGNRVNFLPIPFGSTNANFGSVRGEGIIYEGANTAGLSIDAFDLKIIGTGHYGIGVQNVKVLRALISDIFFDDIGGDNIDVKWFSAPDFDKNLIIQNIYSTGCGKYYLGTGEDGEDSYTNANQACIDVGGKTIVRNIHIFGLDSDPASYGNCGVRLRAKVNNQHREDARGSSVDGVYVWGAKPDNTGSNAQRRIVGVQINSPQVSVSNITAINCFYGLRVHDSGDSVPRDVNLNNITAINCQGAAGDGMGISVSNACRGVTGTNLKAIGCDVGLLVSGRGGSYSNIRLSGNNLGLSASDATLLYNDIVGIHYGLEADGEANLADTNMVYTPAASAMFRNMTSITARRRAFVHHVSTANDAGWSGDDLWLGGDIFTKGDESGLPGKVMTTGARATGINGGSFEWAVHHEGQTQPALRVGSATVRFSVPAQYDGTNQIFNVYNSSKNDAAWSGLDVWLGGDRFLTADTSGTPGEVVRLGARATGASGTAFGHAVQIGSDLKLFVQAAEIQLGATARYMVDNSYSFGTAAYRATTIYATTGSIQTCDETEKQWIGAMSDAELRAGRRILKELGHFQWLDSIAVKGEDAARIHFGPRAQRVFAIMEEEGLDWRRYGWCCHDSWDAEAEETEPVMAFVERERPVTVYEPTGVDDEGDPIYRQVEVMEPYLAEEPTGEVNIIRPARPAGERYGIRSDQLALFLIAVNDARLEALEAA
jgi:hypothetical protein